MLFFGIVGVAMCQRPPIISPLPPNPLELVTGIVENVETPAARQAVVKLLDQARSHQLHAAGRSYRLRVRFTVNSGGQTEYDGEWTWDQVFDPKLGSRWTAQSSSGYSRTEIDTIDSAYAEGTQGATIPLRLHEARAAVLGPIGTNSDQKALRVANVDYRGSRLTCILLTEPINMRSAIVGRRWEERENCIDSKSGLLQVSSQAPGRYYLYDYDEAPRLADCALPRRVTVTEAGRIVAEIRVESLTELPSVDPSLFVPSEEMKARGRAIGMGEARRFWPAARLGMVSPGNASQTVCVFGLMTPAGQLVEVHSLQPSDPNSESAIGLAKAQRFPVTPGPNGRAEQRFVFLIQEFVTSP